jgi:Zn-dependent peptidase ImmA (M78 family)
MGKKNYAYINYKILKWARDKSPISLEDIPIRIKDISSEDVEKWEKGVDFPSINEAKELANLYDVPFAALYLNEIPDKDETKFIDRRTYKDNLNTEISYELWKEINRLKSCRESAIELLNLDRYINSINKFKTNEETDQIIDEVRKTFEIETPLKNKTEYSNKAFNYYRKKIEKNGIMVLQIEGITIEEIRGMSFNYKILPIIAVNKKDSDRAKVFTMFHELAHLIRRTSNICLIDFNERADGEEKNCNNMAANILIPKEELNNSIKNIDIRLDEEIEKIADKFTVSKFVIIKRLFDLNKIEFTIYKNKYNKYLNEFNEIKEIKRKSGQKVIVLPDKKLISSNGNLFPQIILDAYYDGKISFGEVCNTLNVKSKYVENIEKMVMFNE